VIEKRSNFSCSWSSVSTLKQFQKFFSATVLINTDFTTLTC